MVGEIDDDVINLVSMLFEFILDDRTLPDSLKALIGRLQIPLLKVAVLDKTFFSRGSHPARRLLNEIASAAMGWGDQDEAQRDSLYQKIEQIVARLLNDFTDDPAIFSELLADFLAFIGDERRRLSQADLGLITDAAFRRPHGQHVLYAVTENRLHMVLIVTTERKGDDLSSLRVEKPLTQIVAASSTATP